MGGPRGNTELQAHHRLPISQGGSHQLNNLVTLCPDCHNAQHSHDLNRDRNTDDNHGSGARIRPSKQSGSSSGQSHTATHNAGSQEKQDPRSGSRLTGALKMFLLMFVYHIALPVCGVLAYISVLYLLIQGMTDLPTLIFAGTVIAIAAGVGSIGTRFPYAVIKGYVLVGAFVFLGGSSIGDAIMSNTTGNSTVETVGIVSVVLFVFLGPLVIAIAFGLFDNSLLKKISVRSDSL